MSDDSRVGKMRLFLEGKELWAFHGPSADSLVGTAVTTDVNVVNFVNYISFPSDGGVLLVAVDGLYSNQSVDFIEEVVQKSDIYVEIASLQNGRVFYEYYPARRRIFIQKLNQEVTNAAFDWEMSDHVSNAYDMGAGIYW